MPTILVLFGITGDLAKRKIIPALYHLFSKNLLPSMFSVVGYSRRELSKQELMDYVKEILNQHKDINPSEDELNRFLQMFNYQQGYFDKSEGYENLEKMLGQQDTQWKACSSKLFYLSVPPTYYETILDELHKSSLTQHCSEEEGWTRIIVEKPFGKDLNTAQELDKKLGKLFKEEQIYRIDHYLGKEIVQNLLVFRFSNNLLENSWDNQHVEEIKVSLYESIGIEGRVNYYDGIGALRDMGQNHILQMLALITMNNPEDFSDTSIRSKRVELLNDLEHPSSTIRAQYSEYKTLDEVSENSDTETFFRLQTQINNDRWKGVPIILESGKYLDKTDKKITVSLKHKTPCFCPGDQHYKNRIVFDLDGEDQGITIEFWAKKPGLTTELQKREFIMPICEDEEMCKPSEAYEKLLIDCIDGNQTLFVSTDEIKAMWKFIDPIINSWKQNSTPLKIYEKGSSPKEL